MKTTILLLPLLAFMLSCSNAPKPSAEIQEPVSTRTMDVENRTFDDLFTAMQANDITDNVFQLVHRNYLITSGTSETYNSMVASHGGFGELWSLPVTWAYIVSNRYTWEVMLENQTYTLTFFDDLHKDNVLYFAKESGRNTDKMKKHPFTYVDTPSGNPAYKEARMIIECKLLESTTVKPENYHSEVGKNFSTRDFENAKQYREMAFGEITNVWVRK